MQRALTVLLATAALILPALSIAGHVDFDLGSSGASQELLVTGHETPDRALHFEALSGTVELYCLGCALDKRQSVTAAVVQSAPRPTTLGPRGRADSTSQRRLELPANRAPRGPPVS